MYLFFSISFLTRDAFAYIKRNRIERFKMRRILFRLLNLVFLRRTHAIQIVFSSRSYILLLLFEISEEIFIGPDIIFTIGRSAKKKKPSLPHPYSYSPTKQKLDFITVLRRRRRQESKRNDFHNFFSRSRLSPSASKCRTRHFIEKPSWKEKSNVKVGFYFVSLSRNTRLFVT